MCRSNEPAIHDHPGAGAAVPAAHASRRIAIIGGGVSGLAAAWHLHVNSEKTGDVGACVYVMDETVTSSVVDVVVLVVHHEGVVAYLV